MHQHWIFEIAEQDPERLLAMSEEEFRSALADAGFDPDDLVDQFHESVAALFLSIQSGSES